MLLLPLALPVMAIVALAIRAEGPGPILFRQARIGYAGTRITVYKFRTMQPVSIEDERRGGDDRRGRRADHPRRRVPAPTRIDELPQIFNILNGR